MKPKDTIRSEAECAPVKVGSIFLPGRQDAVMLARPLLGMDCPARAIHPEPFPFVLLLDVTRSEGDICRDTGILPLRALEDECGPLPRISVGSVYRFKEEENMEL